MAAAAYDHRAYMAAWRTANLEKIAAYRAANREKMRAVDRDHASAGRKQVAVLKAGPCMDCGVSYPSCVMDFDHRPGTTKTRGGVSQMSKAPWERVLDEVAKCDLVCSNCHRIRTRDRANGGR